MATKALPIIAAALLVFAILAPIAVPACHANYVSFECCYSENAPLYDGSYKGECTSWIASGNATATGETIYHKNRDRGGRERQVLVHIDPPSGHSFYGITTEGQLDRMAFGINDAGLAVGDNDAPTWDMNPAGLNDLVIMRMLLENASTVEEAYAFLSNLTAQGLPATGEMYFIAQKDKAAIFEVTAHAISGFEESLVIDEVEYRANSFKIMPEYNLVPMLPITGDTELRYVQAKEMAETKSGSITVEDVNNWARSHIEMEPLKTADLGNICNEGTVIGCTAVIDSECPEKLSVMWLAMGRPCCSVYIPFIVGSSAIIEPLATGAAFDAAEKIFEEKGGHGGITDILRKIESPLYGEVNSLRDDMRVRISAGDIDSAAYLDDMNSAIGLNASSQLFAAAGLAPLENAAQEQSENYDYTSETPGFEVAALVCMVGVAIMVKRMRR